VSGGARPDLEALDELASVLLHLEGELASWRRRALTAEQQVAESARGGTADDAALADENTELARRLEAAKVRVADLLDRLRFLEEQRDNGGTEG